MYGCVMNAVHTYLTSVTFAKVYFPETLKPYDLQGYHVCEDDFEGPCSDFEEIVRGGLR